MPVTPQPDSLSDDTDPPREKGQFSDIYSSYDDRDYHREFKTLVEDTYLNGSAEAVIKCFSMRPRFLDGETASRLALSLLRVEAFDLVICLFRSYRDIEFVMRSSALLALVEGVKNNTKHEGELRIWPEAGLPDAAQTTIYHAQSIIISRQRAMIDNLLSRL
jgi:hypothetical protein